MRYVKVNKGELLEKMVANRKGHKAAYEKAFAGYRQECIEKLEAELHELKKGNHIVRFHERPPEDCTDVYDRVIAMLNMSTDGSVELTEQEFAQYVQDDWGWKASWHLSNAQYITKAGQ